jgi:septum formation protein
VFSNLEKYHVILASNSPRRQSLLKELGVIFSVKGSLGKETYPKDLETLRVAEFLAIQKADWFNSFENNELYITADTIVVLEGDVLGKPNSAKEAKEMIRSLSSKKHEVITGVCVKSKDTQESFSVITNVYFKELTEESINYYVDNFKPFDKAGSYGIQEWIGMTGIVKIEGSYFNVVGLPTDVLFQVLKKF